MIIVLVIIILVLCYVLISYRRNIKALNEQINFKLESKSNIRPRLDYHNKEFNKLSESVDNLFESVKKEEYLASQERRTLDMAISNISHDIRTPLTVSRGYTQQLLRKGEYDRTILEKIDKNLNSASTRLEMLLEYRRILEQAIVPKKEKVDVKAIVTKQLFSFYDAFSSEDFDVQMYLEEITIESDSEILERILQNIFSNVLKHGKESMNVTLKREDAHAVLEVSNISKNKIEHLDRLTSRFYSENMSQSEDSSGLGLYIVEELVQALGGSVRLFYDNNYFTLLVVLD